MTTTQTTKQTRRRPTHSPTEAQAIEKEVIDTLLQTDRAHHDELGRTEESVESEDHPAEVPPGPREQSAVALDMAKIDE